MHATQTPLPGPEIVLIGLITSVVVIAQATWPLVQHFEVMAHEGMHAVVGSLAGRTVLGIELDGNAGGATGLAPTAGPGFLVAGIAGYLGPSAFGLFAARMIEFRHTIAVLWVTMLFLVLLLIKLTPSFGFFTVPVAGILIVLVLTHTSQIGEIRAAYAITWFLLLSAVRIVWSHATGGGAADAAILRGRTGVPMDVWHVLWLCGTLTALVIGAHWMLFPVVHSAVHPAAR
jgi:peptidase M50B-like protein